MAEEQDPPYRLDPLQNIVNVRGNKKKKSTPGVSWAVIRMHDGIGIPVLNPEAGASAFFQRLGPESQAEKAVNMKDPDSGLKAVVGGTDERISISSPFMRIFPFRQQRGWMGDPAHSEIRSDPTAGYIYGGTQSGDRLALVPPVSADGGGVETACLINIERLKKEFPPDGGQWVIKATALGGKCLSTLEMYDTQPKVTGKGIGSGRTLIKRVRVVLLNELLPFVVWGFDGSFILGANA